MDNLVTNPTVVITSRVLEKIIFWLMIQKGNINLK